MLNQIVLVGKMSEIKEQDGKVNLKLNVQNEFMIHQVSMITK